MDMGSGGHGGDVYRNRVAYDFSVNVNPLGMPDAVKQVLHDSVEGWSAYPDPDCRELTEALAEKYGAGPDWIVCGNGAADLIHELARAVRPEKALLMSPAFSEYERALRGTGCRLSFYELREEDGFIPDMDRFAGMVTEDTDMVFLCNPNNPNGMPVAREHVLMLADACKRAQAVLVTDECFCELTEAPEAYSVISCLQDRPGIVVLRAFTKTYAMAGLRLGYMICSNPHLAGRIRAARQPWSVSLPAQQAGTAALGEREYLDQARQLIARERAAVKQALGRLGFRVYPSEANFLLFRYEEEAGGTGASGSAVTAGGNLWKRCRDQGILIRDCSNYRGLGAGYYRVSIRLPEENRELLRVLGRVV